LFLLTKSIQAQDINPQIFLDNIELKIFPVSNTGSLDTGDVHDIRKQIYVDLNRKSFTAPRNYHSNEDSEEYFVNFDFVVRKGSFINSNQEEYLFIIFLNEENYLPFFGHANNYGNTTLVYIFDKNFHQISPVRFCDS